MPEPAFGIEPTGKAGGSSNSCISPRARFIWRLFLMLALVSIIYSFPKDVKTAFLTVPNPYVDVCKMYMDRFITVMLLIALDFCLEWVYSLPLRLAACGILYFFYLVCNVLDCMTVSAQCIGIMSTVIVLRRTERWGVRFLSPLVNGVLSLTTFHLKMVPGKPYEPRLLDYMAFNLLLAFFAACHAGLWLQEKWLPYQTLAIAVTIIYMLYTNMPASLPFSPLRTWLTSFVCLVFATYSAGLWAVLSSDLPPLFRHEEIFVWWQKWPITYFYVKDEMLVVINYMLCLKTLALVVGAVLAFAASYPFMITEFGVPAVVSCARLVLQSMRSEEKKTMGATCMAITPRRAMELPVEVEQMQETDIVRSLSIYPSPIGPMNQTVVTTDNVEVTLTIYTRPVVYTTATVYTTPVIYLAPVTYLAKVVYTAPVVFRASVMFGEQGRVLFMGPVMQVMVPMVEAPVENANVEAEERVREIAAPVLEDNTSRARVIVRKRKSMDLQPAFATLKMHIMIMHLAEFIPESATRASVDPKTAVRDEPALDDMTFMVESETSSEVDESAPAVVEPVTCASAEQVISFMVEDTIHASAELGVVTTEQAELSADLPDVVVAPLDVPEAPADVHAREQVEEHITPALNEMPSVAPVDVFPELNDAHVEAAAHVEESTYVEEPTYVEEISPVEPNTVTPIVVEHSSSDDGSVSDGWITSSPTPSSRTSLADDDQPDKELASDDLNEAAAQDHNSREGAAVAMTHARSKISDFERIAEQLRELKSEAETATRKPLAVRPKIKAGFLGHLSSAVARPPATQSSPRRFTAAEKGKGRAQEIPEDPFVDESRADQHTEAHVARDYPAQDHFVGKALELPAIDSGDASASWADDTEALYSKPKEDDEPGKNDWPAKDDTAPSDDGVDDDDDDDDDNGPPPIGGCIRLPSTPPRRSPAPPAQELSRWATPSPTIGSADNSWRSPRQPTREPRGSSSFTPNETRHDSGPSAPRRTTRYPRQARDRATRSAGMRPAEGSSAEGAADGNWKRAQQRTLRQDRSPSRRDGPESSSGLSTSSSGHAPRTPPPARRFDRDNRAGDRDIALTSRAGPFGSHGHPPRPPRQVNDQRPDRRAPRSHALADRTDDEVHSRFGGMRSDAFDNEASRSGPSSSSPRHPRRHGHQNGTPNPHHGPRDDQARRQPRQDGGGPSTAPTAHSLPDRPAEYNWEAHREHTYQSHRTQRRQR
ncbi:hypothetical protein K523DRAFT_351971 [Schizophyllum commune Tattone D]|nr:hypothetical protein K523DRAFT_351971 [Schizophyllum commune Tattone D]